MGKAVFASRLLLMWAAFSIPTASHCNLDHNHGHKNTVKLCNDCFEIAISVICRKNIDRSQSNSNGCCKNCTFNKLLKSCVLPNPELPNDEARPRSQERGLPPKWKKFFQHSRKNQNGTTKKFQQPKEGELSSSGILGCDRLKYENPNFMEDMEKERKVMNKTISKSCREHLYKMCPNLKPPPENKCKEAGLTQVLSLIGRLDRILWRKDKEQVYKKHVYGSPPFSPRPSGRGRKMSSTSRTVDPQVTRYVL
ncbi:uncharacterized protein LOC143040911 [Oratosquilla oratoria]|uniref:uncharacterized protein LOC143040911 n=1 Tax=Oratosquilla oratoria TaxID=337810 RepID=UPI003F76CD1C